MLTLGIDVGHCNTKAVLLEDGFVIGKVIFRAAGSVQKAAVEAWEKIREVTGIHKRSYPRVFVTGVGRDKGFGGDGTPTEMASHVRGVYHWLPSVRTVVDLGAEGVRVSRCDHGGKLVNFVLNDRCAAGTGMFLETVAQMLELSVSEMGSLALRGSPGVRLTSTCAIFAESEIVGYVHKGVSRQDILWAVHDSLGARVAALVQKVGPRPEVVATGGAARNKGLLKALEFHLGFPVMVLHEPELMGALGAALLAADSWEVKGECFSVE